MPTLEDRNKRIVQRWIEDVFNNGDLRAVDELKVQSYLDWTPSPYQRVELPVSGIKDGLPKWLAALPDFEFSSDRMLAEGDFVVCLGHWNAHHSGTLPLGERSLAPTERQVGGRRVDIFRIAGDKMVEHWGCGNELAFLQLVDALPEGAGVAPADDADVAREFVEKALGGRDIAAAAALLDPHAVDHGGMAISVFALYTGFPHLDLGVEDLAAANGDVVVTTTISGTHEGPFMGIAATGRQVSATRVDRFRVEGGRIVETWRESDDGELFAQLAA